MKSRHIGLVLLALMLSACATPIVTAGVNIGPGGVTVTPGVVTTLGGAKVSVSP
jgi:hypothetical protein